MNEKSASEQIDDIIAMHGGWKAQILTQVRAAIRAADPSVTEEIKWKMPSLPEGRPVWSHNGILCIAEIFKNDIKIVFFKGALMKDMQQHFNARLTSSTDRAIAYHDGDTVDETALQALVTEAVRLNTNKS